MMQTISVAEATTHISTLLNQIEAGVEIMITRWGQAIARIIPIKKTLNLIFFRDLEFIKIPFKEKSFRVRNLAGLAELL